MKSVVRRDILQKINGLSREEKKRQSRLIQQQLQELLRDESGAWVGYHHLSDEPEIQWAEVSGRITWAFPRITGGALDFRRDARNYARSPLGFSEPQDGVRLGTGEIRGFVIPAVAYGHDGRRMGRGQGYYDRALHGFSGPKIGVCFNVSVCEELPHEEHDIQCDLVVAAGHVYGSAKSEGVKKWN